jgi:hypothetical protein
MGILSELPLFFNRKKPQTSVFLSPLGFAEAGMTNLFAGDTGGRNEETYSGYAGGIPVGRYPSRRQHKQINH